MRCTAAVPSPWFIRVLVLAFVGLPAWPGLAAVYEVGPGQPYTTLRAVPWTALQPGDVVNVHPQATPYYEKLALSRSGTAVAPITIHGVLDGQGNRPILDGTNAIQNNDNVVNPDRGLIITGNGGDSTGQYWVIENLELRNAASGGTFYRGGTPYTYGSNAAGVFLQGGKSAILRNCWIHDNSNGVQTGSKSQGVTDVLIEYCRVENNGVVGSQYQHNFYNGAEPLTVQYCYIGGLQAGADGQNFKDRGSGTVFRYNWLEGGPNDQLDLVDGGTKPAHAYVYGNVIIKNNPSGNGRLCLFGNDSGGSRSGTLYFVNNTVITTRSLTYLFQMPNADCQVQMHNNVVYYPGGGTFPQIRSDAGVVTGSYNWISPGYSLGGATLTNTIPASGNNPGFVNYAAQDFHLLASGTCVDAGATSWPGQAQSTAVQQYVKHQAYEPRPVDSHIDIGAYEYAAPPEPPHVTAVSPALGQVIQTSTNLSQIAVTFDASVEIAAPDVSLTGTTTGLVGFTLGFDGGTNTATLTFATPLPDDAYALTVSDSVTVGGVALDGEVGDPEDPALPSGNGSAGGDFTVHVYRLMGDIDGNRAVDIFDVIDVVTHFGQPAAVLPRADLDGSGTIDVFDVIDVINQFGQSLPPPP